MLNRAIFSRFMVALCIILVATFPVKSSQDNYDFSIGFIYNPSDPEAQLTREIMEAIFVIYRVHTDQNRVLKKESKYQDIGVYISSDVVLDDGMLNGKQLEDNGILFDINARYFSTSTNCRLYAFDTRNQDETKYLSIINIKNDGDMKFESSCAAAVISAIYGLDFESIVGESMPEIIRNRLAMD